MRGLIGNTEVESVLGRVINGSACGGGDVMSNDGLEQLPMAERDNEPLWDRDKSAGGVEGDNEYVEVGGDEDVGLRAARLTLSLSHYYN